MPTVFLDRAEIDLLLSLDPKREEPFEFRRLIRRWHLLVDHETGEIEIPGEMLDEMRVCAFDLENIRVERTILSIFSRTLGRYLDLGFFEETDE